MGIRIDGNKKFLKIFFLDKSIASNLSFQKVLVPKLNVINAMNINTITNMEV